MEKLINTCCMLEEMQELMIAEKSNDYNWKLYTACFNGQKEMVELIILQAEQNSKNVANSRGSTPRAKRGGGTPDWNLGLAGACFGGHKEIVNMMILKGAVMFNWGLDQACYGGHLEIVKMMIEKGAKNWNIGLYGACCGGQRDMVELMLSKGATDMNIGLEGACNGGHIGLVKFMTFLGADSWNDGLHGACRGGQKEMANLMIESAMKDSTYGSKENRKLNWNIGLEGACKGGQIEMVKMMLDRGAKIFDKELYYAYRNKDIALLLIAHGAESKSWDHISLDERDIEYLLLCNVKFANKYEPISKHCLTKIIFTLTKLLCPILVDDLIPIIFSYIW